MLYSLNQHRSHGPIFRTRVTILLRNPPRDVCNASYLNNISSVCLDPRVAGAFHTMVNDVLCKSEWPVIVIAATSSPKLIASDLYSGFLHQFSIKVHFTIIARFEIRIL